jgi:hypothetical protein
MPHHGGSSNGKRQALINLIDKLRLGLTPVLDDCDHQQLQDNIASSDSIPADSF